MPEDHVGQIGCTWAQQDEDSWLSDCGELSSYSEGSPTELEFRFCPYCGEPINIVNLDDDE